MGVRLTMRRGIQLAEDAVSMEGFQSCHGNTVGREREVLVEEALGLGLVVQEVLVNQGEELS